MNLQGVQQYSNAIKGLRQSDFIKDQNLSLIFIYPILFDVGLSKNNLLIRDFLTSSFLKEILISNYLNLISMTSQISPLSDESGTQLDLASTLSQIISGNTINPQIYYSNKFYRDKYELQNQINKKFDEIQKYLNIDPNIKKLNPKVKVISLENTIEVPIIIGTSSMDLDSLSLLTFLTISIGKNLPLDNYNNIEKITNFIRNTKVENIKNLIKSPFSENNIRFKISNFYQNNPTFSRIVNSISRVIGKKASIYIASKFIKPSQDSTLEINDEAFFLMAKTVKSKIDEIEMNFRFVLKEKLLKERYGLSTERKLESTISMLSNDEKIIFNKMQDNFIQSLSIPGVRIIRSCSNLIHPVNNPQVNFVNIYEEHFSKNLNKNIDKFIKTTLIPSITTELKNLDLTETSNIKIIKGICEKASDYIEFFKKIDSSIERSVINIPVNQGDEQDITNFLSMIESVSTKVQNINNIIYKAIIPISRNHTVVFNELEKIINDSIINFFEEYNRQSFNDEAILRVNNSVLVNKLKKDLINSLFHIIKFFFLVPLIIAVCEYVKIIDVEIGTKKNEITEFPNYTLVLPVEVIIALYNAYISGNLDKIINEKMDYNKKNINLNDNYIKGMINYLNLKLKVPNLIVIDNKNNDIYYKFMYMSSINKTKLSTIQSFVELQ